MAGLPKRYAKMGFKKGWKAFKRAKKSYSKPKRRTATRKRKKRRKVRTMARRKKYKRRYSRGTNPTKMIMGGIAYGAGREYISNLLGGFIGNIGGGLGEYSDELVMGVVSWLAYKRGRGFIKEFGKAGLYIESSRVGSTLIGGLGNNSGGSAYV